ncbi:hypothetical protein JYT20_01050 [Rhodothermus sp. AH-315-K08]|nr:hypothetical protein [Rhodothermus sp. AH-315-K08]
MATPPDEASHPPEIRDSLNRFFIDHPATARTAFVMMPFEESASHAAITAGIRTTLAGFGIRGLRVDAKEYHDDLLYNVLTYAHGCGFGVAVHERIKNEAFNANVALEVGYMMALRKPICLLKDKSIPALQADLGSRLYRDFDVHDLPGSLKGPLEKWMSDHGLAPPSSEIVTGAISYSYHGPDTRVRLFAEEIRKIEVFPTVSLVYEDGSADIRFSYNGKLPRSYFETLAADTGISPGTRPPEHPSEPSQKETEMSLARALGASGLDVGSVHAMDAFFRGWMSDPESKFSEKGTSRSWAIEFLTPYGTWKAGVMGNSVITHLRRKGFTRPEVSLMTGIGLQDIA